MENFSLKITFSIISTIVALLMINLIASANRIFLPIVVQGEDVTFVPAVLTSDNHISTPPIPLPDHDHKGPQTPTPTATFLPGVPTYTPSPTSTPWPTFTPSLTFTPGPSPTNLRIGPGTTVPDGWAPPP